MNVEATTAINGVLKQLAQIFHVKSFTILYEILFTDKVTVGIQIFFQIRPEDRQEE